MLKIILVSVLIFSTNSFADLGDGFAKIIFQKKVDQLYEKALLCSPLEIDPKSSLDVNDWIKIQPLLPPWGMLTQIEEVAEESRRYARSVKGNDKRLHCLAGCFIARKLDYKSAVLVGWLKELRDASDCSKKTSFEKKDYDATLEGARAYDSKEDCEIICQNNMKKRSI